MFDTLVRCGMLKANSRHAELLREASEARLARLATVHRHSLGSQLFSRVGDLLISSGMGLKQRCRQEVAQAQVSVRQTGQCI